MSDTPMQNQPGTESEHAWVHEHLAAYLAGGLEAGERARLDGHINACQDCFNDFTEARDADRALQRTLAGLAPDNKLEERMVTQFRENTMKRYVMARRVAYATAACVALAATGVFANYAMRQGDMFNNPLSKHLAASADRADPRLANLLHKDGELASLQPRVAKYTGDTAVRYRAKNEADNQQRAAEMAIIKLQEQIAQAPQGGLGGGGSATDGTNKQRVEELAGEAKKRFASADFQDAEQFYDKLAAADPQNQEARLGVLRSQAAMADRKYGDIVRGEGEQSVRRGLERQVDARDYYAWGLQDGVQRGAAVPASQPARSSDLATLLTDRFGTATPGSQTGAVPQSVGGGYLAFNDMVVPGASAENGREWRFGGGHNVVAGEAAGAGQKELGDKLLTGNFSVNGGTLALGGGNSFVPSNKPDNSGNTPTVTGKVAGSGNAAVDALAQRKLDEQIAQAANAPAKESDSEKVSAPRINLQNLTENVRTQQFGSGGNGLFSNGGVAGGEAALGEREKNNQVALGFSPVDPQRQPGGQSGSGAGRPPTPQGGGATTAAATQTAPEVSALKIIRNGVIEFEVRSFDDTYMTVTRIVQDEKGFVSSTSSDKLANGKVRGVIVVRVPPERLDRFLLSIRALGELKAQQIAAADVTKQYYDIESELRGLVTMETRLLDLIKNGKGEVKDLIEAEKQLGETRVRIEKLKGEISYYNNLVGMATITITAYEKDISTPTAASEQEIVNVNVETEEVEAKYQAARKIFDEAKSRIVESQLKNADAEHVAAHIVADVPPDSADFVSGQLKQLGKVASFNRDRKQTTTGGAGMPAPNVQVEHKDTRITIDLFNLANMQPRETTVLRVAVRDVAGTYGRIRDLLRQDAPAPTPAPGEAAASRTIGRVIASNLNGQQPEQMSAELRAEVRADQADAVLAAIREGSEVLASSLAVNQDNAGTTMAKRGLQLSLVNIAAVPAKETDTMSIAVRDVEAAYKNLLQAIARNVAVPQGAPAANPLMTPTVGRVIASTLNGQQPEQKIGDVRAEVREDQADAVISALRGSGEVISSAMAESPEGSSATRIKRTLAVRMVSVAAVPPREAQSLTTVAEDVPGAFGKLMAALQSPQLDANVRVLSSQLNQADARNVSATLAFEARREVLGDVDKAFRDAGIEMLSRNVARSTDTAGTLDSKVLFQVRELKSAESLAPRRTMVVSREVENVSAAMEKLRGALKGKPVREVDYNVSREPGGRATGRIVLDMPVGTTPVVWADIASMGGMERSNEETRNTQVADSRFAKERIELTLIGREGIVQGGQGLWASVRAALSSAAGALLYSLYLVLTGVLFALPFALIIWPLWKLNRRRKAEAS